MIFWATKHTKKGAYDPNCKLLVSGRGYLYDPECMDWVRLERLPLPFTFDWAHTFVGTSRHGAVAWAHKKGRDECGLWLFDREKGWTDLEPKGKLFAPYCDSHGMVYDSKRDRMILSGVGGGYSKISNGTFLAFDFKTRELAPLAVPRIRLCLPVMDVAQVRGTYRLRNLLPLVLRLLEFIRHDLQ